LLTVVTLILTWLRQYYQTGVDRYRFANKHQSVNQSVSQSINQDFNASWQTAARQSESSETVSERWLRQKTLLQSLFSSCCSRIQSVILWVAR